MHTVLDIAQYFLHLDNANDGDGLSNLKIQKLVYYAQGFHCAIRGEPLFGEPIEAWTHGPVVPELYQAFKEHGRNNVPLDPFFTTDGFNPESMSVIDEVFDVFGQYTAWRLRDMTHEESPWIKYESTAGTIPTDELTEYFQTHLN